MANDDLSAVAADVLYCKQHDLLRDDVGRALLNIYHAGVADTAVAYMIKQRATKHKYRQAFGANTPFKQPKLNEGDYIVGLAQDD